MNYQKISMSEAIALIIVIMVNQIFLGDAKYIFTTTLSSAWLNTIFIFIIALVLVFVITKLYKKFTNLDILDISKYLGGNVLKNIVSIISILFFILSAAIILYYVSDSLEIIYLSNINIIFIQFVFLLGATVCASRGINAISKTNLIFIYIITIPMIALGTFSVFNGHSEYYFPILGNGFKETFFDNTTNVFAFSGLVYLFFITPFLNNTTDFNKISFISIILSFLYLLYSVISLLMTFPFSDLTENLLSIHLLSRAISVGSFLERVDALYIFLWALSAFSYLSILIFYICNTFKKITNIKNYTAMVFVVMTTIWGATLAIPNLAIFRLLHFSIFKYFSIGLIVLFVFILVIAYFKNKKNSHDISEIQKG